MAVFRVEKTKRYITPEDSQTWGMPDESAMTYAQAKEAINQKVTEQYGLTLEQLAVEEDVRYISPPGRTGYVELSEQFSQERNRCEQLIREAELEVSDLDTRIATGDNRRAVVEKYVELDNLNRAAVEVLIDHVCVGKRIPKTRDVPIEIHWNF